MVKFGAAAVVVVVGGWSGLWFLASARAGTELDAWIAREAAHGRQWTCPGRQIGGYPFGIEVACAQPTFAGEVAGRQSAGTLESLRASVRLHQPRVVAIDLVGPMNLHATNDEFNLVASWASMHLTLGELPDRLRQGTVEASRLGVTVSGPDREFNLRVANLSGGAEPASANPADQPVPAGPSGDEAFRFIASGLTLPTVDTMVGDDAPADAEGSGVLARADLLSAPTVTRLEAWRGAGGRLDLASLTLRKGTFFGRASGSVGLDPEHRMSGQLDAALSSFGPLAQRFGIPIAGVKLGGLLSSLLGGKKPSSAAPSGKDEVRLPLTFADGRLSVGPFQTPLRINPLY